MPSFKYHKSLLFLTIFCLAIGCTNKNRYIKLTNTLPETTVEVFKESIEGKEPLKTTIAPGDSLKVFKFEPGEAFYFKAVGVQDFEVLPYAIDTLEQQYYEIALNKKVYAEVSDRYKPLPNITASEYALDILKVDPFNQFDGRTQQIFSVLKEDDRNWKLTENNFALKDHFIIQPIRRALIKTKPSHSLAISAEGFQKLFSKSFKTDDSYQNTIATKSVTWSGILPDSINPPYLFSWYKDQKERFSVEIDPEKQQLNPAFVSAINALPIIRELPDSIATINVPSSLKPYFDFIGQWGTHYPKKIAYGDGLLAANALLGNEVINLASNGIEIKAAITHKIEKRTGRNTDEKPQATDAILKNSKMTLLQKQLASAALISDPNMYPISRELKPLFSLLEASIFPDSLGLDEKKKALQLATEAYVSNKFMDTTQFQVYGFKLNCYGLYLGESRDMANPKNTISEALVEMGIKKPEGLSQRIWNKAIRYAPNHRAVYKLNKKGSMQKLPIKEDWNRGFTLRDINIYVDLDVIPEEYRDKLYFYFSGTFNEKDGNTGKYDDTIAGETLIPINQMLQQNGGSISLWCYDIKKEREFGDLDINISFDIEVLKIY